MSNYIARGAMRAFMFAGGVIGVVVASVNITGGPNDFLFMALGFLSGYLTIAGIAGVR